MQLVVDELVAPDARERYRVEVAVAAMPTLAARCRAAGHVATESRAGVLAVSGRDLPAGGVTVLARVAAGVVGPLVSQDLAARDYAALREATVSVVLEAQLGRDWRSDVARVLRLARSLCPDALGLFDAGSLSWWSWRYVEAVADGRPVRLSELFQIHLLSDHAGFWAHTHGLRRLGLIELEYLASASVDSPAPPVRTLNAIANVLEVTGVPAPRTPFRFVETSAVVWLPPRDITWESGSLGAVADRDEAHSGASGLIMFCADEVPLAPGVCLNRDGWAVAETELVAFEQLARATVGDALAAGSEPGRSSWLVSGELVGDVVSFDRDSAVVLEDGTVVEHRIALDSVDDWGVTSATSTGYAIGPWLAHHLDDVEDRERGADSTRDEHGRPTCAICGDPIGPDHTCGRGTE